MLSEVLVIDLNRAMYQKIGQRKYPAEQEGRKSRVNEEGDNIVTDSMQAKRPNITQRADEIDWSSDDLSHRKLKQLRILLPTCR